MAFFFFFFFPWIYRTGLFNAECMAGKMGKEDLSDKDFA